MIAGPCVTESLDPGLLSPERRKLMDVLLIELLILMGKLSIPNP